MRVLKNGDGYLLRLSNRERNTLLYAIEVALATGEEHPASPELGDLIDEYQEHEAALEQFAESLFLAGERNTSRRKQRV